MGELRLNLMNYLNLSVDYSTVEGKNNYNNDLEPIIVNKEHLIKLLESNLSDAQILEWVNFIWFSDFYEYNDNESDSIASVMDYLEELDEGRTFNDDIRNEMIFSLKNNKEFFPKK
jgi:hypothetical protein